MVEMPSVGYSEGSRSPLKAVWYAAYAVGQAPDVVPQLRRLPGGTRVGEHTWEVPAGGPKGGSDDPPRPFLL